jgi:hypothetical protein
MTLVTVHLSKRKSHLKNHLTRYVHGILATQEAEIRKITARCWPGENSLLDTISMEKWAVVHTCHASDSGKLKIGGLRIRSACAKNWHRLQNNQSKKSWGMFQVIEYVSSQWEYLSSTPGTDKKEENHKLYFCGFTYKTHLFI